jgi:hypothetical protein
MKSGASPVRSTKITAAASTTPGSSAVGKGWLPEIPLLTAGQAVADWLEAWTGRPGRNGFTLVVTIPGVPRFVGPG